MVKRLYDVLVVEDDLVDTKTMKRFLEKEGFCNTVDYVATARAARSAIRKKNYDIVILDVELPDGDGLVLAREIWMINSRIITICSSGHTDASTLSSARDSKVTAFIEKPVTMEQLKAATEIINNSADKKLEIGFGFIGEDVA